VPGELDNIGGDRNGEAMTRAVRLRVAFIILALIARWLLEAAYADSVAPYYAYAGYTYYPEAGFTLLTYLMTGCVAAFVPLEATPSRTITLLMFLLFFIPMGMIAATNNKDIGHYLLMCLFMALLVATVRVGHVKPIAIGRIPFGYEIFLLLAFGTIATTIVIFYAREGFALVNFDVTAVYDVRWEINELLAGPVAYLVEWSKNVFLPGLLSLALWRRSWLLAGVTLVFFIIFFGITSAKAVLFYPVLMLLIYAGVRLRNLAMFITSSIISVIGIAWLLTLQIGQNFLSSTLLLRSFSVPTFDSFRYFEYFENMDKMYFRNTLLGAPFRTAESDAIALTIGQNTWGYGSEVQANVGVFATAYMHLGWYGMILFPIIVGGCLRLLDKLSAERIPVDITIMLTSIVGMQFLSGDLTTVLLTGGFVLLTGVLILVGNPEAVQARRELRPALFPVPRPEYI